MEKSGLPEKVTQQNLVGHLVGYTNGSIYGEFLDAAKGIQRELAMSDLGNLRKLVAKRQDYSLVSTTIANYIFKTHPDDFLLRPRLVGTVSNQKMCVGFSRKRPEANEAAALLDQGLIKIRANGSCRKIELDWLGSSSAPEKIADLKFKK